MSRQAEYVTLYKEGCEPVKPFKCELDAYKKAGWSETKPAKSTKPDEAAAESTEKPHTKKRG